MKTYNIPFQYLTEAVAKIQADSLAEAIEIANNLIKTNTTSLLFEAVEAEPIDDSYLVLRDKALELNPMKTYRVEIKRVSTTEVEVEASDRSEAEDMVADMIESGDIRDSDYEIMEEDIESVVDISRD
jgi:uncharacterized cupredoxin-like copper-binding protein